MITSEFFFNLLQKNKFSFFTGVPDSLLKDICGYITSHSNSKNHIIAANEGNAVALATGHYLATGKPALVYLQNSGLGNTINPLTSLASGEVYKIPMLLLIGWRAEPNIHDEPQHKQMGRIQPALLKALEVPSIELGKTEASAKRALQRASDHFRKHSSPFAIVVRKNSFEPYKTTFIKNDQSLTSREEALRTVLPYVGIKDCIISTTGMTSRELFEIRNVRDEKHYQDFMCVGNMGHTSSLALGVALAQPRRQVWCFDGDGSVIMHMGALSVIGQQKPKNLIHLVFNNHVHDSVGGMPTAAMTSNFCHIAQSCGYKRTYSAVSLAELKKILGKISKNSGPVFIEVLCRSGARKDLGRPTTTPEQNKKVFMKFLKI